MAENERDYYEVLGVERNADLKAIKNAYHRLAMKWHPDRNKAPEAEERFKEIAKAYAILSDPNKRARYDSHGMEGVAHFSDEDLFRNLDLGDLFGGLGHGFGFDGNSIFERFFHHEQSPSQRGEDLRVHVAVSLERIAEGGKERVHLRHKVLCESCHGHGTVDGQPAPACSACRGTGRQVSSRDEQRDGGTIRFQQVTICPLCAGRGTQITAPCSSCGGSGEVEREETLDVTIPQGIEDGMVLRVAGHGMPAPQPGLPAGDLHVVVYAEPDPRFQRRGADLWREEVISVPEAVLGGKHRIPTLGGEVEVTLPATTQSGEVLRLRGKGLPRFGGSGEGDLNIRIAIEIPKQIDEEERRLYEQLAAHVKKG